MAKCYGALVGLKIFKQDVILVNDRKILTEMFAESNYGNVFNDRPINAYFRK